MLSPRTPRTSEGPVSADQSGAAVLDSGLLNGRKWTLYAGVNRSDESNYPGLEVQFAHGYARWNDRMLVLSPLSVSPDASAENPADAPPVTVEELQERTEGIFSINGIMIHHADGVSGQSWAFTDEQYTRLALGALCFGRESEGGHHQYGIQMSTQRLRSEHTLDHVAPLFFAPHLSPVQVWGCFYAAYSCPYLSPELIVASVEATSDHVFARTSETNEVTIPAMSLVQPVLFDGATQIPRLFAGHLTDLLWWYLYRIAAAFVATAPSQRQNPGAMDSYTNIDWVDADIRANGLATCVPCATALNMPALPTILTGVDGKRVDAGGFEFFNATIAPDRAVVDARVLTEGEQSDLRHLLDDFICYRMLDYGEDIDADLAALAGKGIAEGRTVFAYDENFAFVPVPVGFFDALLAALEEGGMGTARALLSAGIDGAGNQPDEMIASMNTLLVDSSRTEEFVRVSEIITFPAFSALLDEALVLRGLTGEAGDDWWVEHRLTLSNLAVFWPESEILSGRQSGRFTHLENLSFFRLVLTTVFDYYRSDSDDGALSLDWWLRLSGINARYDDTLSAPARISAL